MKNFFTYVLATIVGMFITGFLCMLGAFLSFVMFLVSVSIGPSTPQTNVSDNSVLYIDLGGQVVERTQGLTFMEQVQGKERDDMPLNDLIAAIRHASDDSRIEGIYLDCNGGGGGMASLTYITEALRDFKSHGKWVAAYGDAYTQANYYVASVADSLWINPIGAVDVHGLGGTLMFYKGLLDKLGIEAQVIKVGTYKSAVEPFILTEPSEANRRQIKEYITPIWEYMTEVMGEGRGVTADSVNMWADSVLVTAPVTELMKLGVVDNMLYRHEAEDRIKLMSGLNTDDNLRMVNAVEYAQNIKHKNKKHNIAVLYAVGDIVEDGREGIVGSRMTPLILDLAEDDDVDALVLRVNSGGGSAFASEQIWEALEQFKAAGKPFYVSMGDVAASGGYYISCGADKIYAQPVTITGSIGIFGVIPCIKGLLNDHLGITTATISTNPNGQMSLTEPFTPVQRAAMQRMIDRGYETFVSRCAQGRGMDVDSIKAIAEGRVWDGVAARRIGLVDVLGNLDRCIADLAAAQGWDSYSTTEYPDPRGKWWEELLMSAQAVRMQIIDSELGEARPYFEAIDRIKNMDRVQCRMQEVDIR